MINSKDDLIVVDAVRETSAIVSKTDLCGMITYANDAFVRISGYTREELIGQPHNIVRHPDMPAWAFADLWGRLEAGDLWRGIVKNLAKDGGSYWVEATVVPIRKAGKTIGYMSVRTMATEQQIQAAEKLYRGALPKQKTGLKLNRMLSIHSGYLLGSLFVMLLLVVGGYLGIGGIRQGGAQLVYQNQQVLHNVVVLGDLNSEVENLKRNTGTVAPVLKSVDENMARLNGLAADENYRASVEEIKKDLVKLSTLQGLSHAGDATAMAHASAVAGKLQSEISALRRTIVASASRQVSQHLQRNELIENISLTGIFLGISLVLLFGWYFMRSIVRPLEMAIDNFDKMAEGDLTGEVQLTGAGETGHLIRSSATMQMHLKVVMDELLLMAEHIDQHCLALNTALFEISDHLDCQHDKLIEAKSLFEMNTTVEIKDKLDHVRAAIQALLQVSGGDMAMQDEIRNDMDEILCLEQLRSHTFNDFLEKIQQLSDLVVDNRMETHEAYSMSAQLHTISTQLKQMVSYFEVVPGTRNG
ncbi:aerotaxis sensor receptor protein [Aquitalea magnusonii]|uniref:Aerotaxis sensor receptor protein n=2 Tax=Aquitalea magnusonii TaxID=332411 RepID=A0A3G9GKR8_9NEIS|nr:PAS domain S-box protein [Aquitalea magnusonii]BBF87209.1 aerotaxis sensor receptor protein [Aquitalea magnusonii]